MRTRRRGRASVRLKCLWLSLWEGRLLSLSESLLGLDERGTLLRDPRRRLLLYARTNRRRRRSRIRWALLLTAKPKRPRARRRRLPLSLRAELLIILLHLHIIRPMRLRKHLMIGITPIPPGRITQRPPALDSRSMQGWKRHITIAASTDGAGRLGACTSTGHNDRVWVGTVRYSFGRMRSERDRADGRRAARVRTLCEANGRDGRRRTATGEPRRRGRWQIALAFSFT